MRRDKQYVVKKVLSIITCISVDLRTDLWLTKSKKYIRKVKMDGMRKRGYGAEESKQWNGE